MSSPRPKTRAQATPSSARRAKGSKPAASRKKVWAKRLGIAALAGFVLALAGFFTAYALIDTPEPNDLASAQASVIYYADGKTELDRISEVNRESVKINQIPTVVREAHLAAEDRTFYKNSGISPTGIARAVWVGLRGGATQGGSTITQQYVKNYFLTQDQTLSRKGKEIVISIKIAKQKSKDQILEDYLNTIYYGRGAYGVQTAAKAYFDKDVTKLNASEGALLASVIRGPSFYDPGLGAEQAQNAKDRWRYVMDGMVSQGYLTSDERAKATFPKVVKYSPDKGASGTTGYLTQQVKAELRSKLKLTDADIDRGGYKIVTTLDAKAQKAAVEAVKARMPEGAAGKDLHVGLTSIKPGDGAIVAMYGGANYAKEQFNASTDAKLQAGSTFKVFTLLAALNEDISTQTRFDGRSPQYFKEFEGAGNEDGKVTNFGFESFGNVDLRTATANSINTVYAQLNIKVGADKTKAAAVAAGLPAKGLGSNPANVLGTDTVNVRDMANAYATVASNGTRVAPYFIKTVKGGPGNLNYKAKVVKKAAFDKKVTADAIDAMTQVVERGSGSFAQGLGRPVAGKTGSTTDNKAAWFDGFTPQLATAVGIYKGDGTKSMSNLPGFGELTGGTVPVKIWTDYMQVALKGQETLQFPERSGVGDDEVYTPPPSTTSSSSSSSTSSTTTSTTSTTTSSTTTTTKPSPTTTVAPPSPTSSTRTKVPNPPNPTGSGTVTLLNNRPQSSPTTSP